MTAITQAEARKATRWFQQVMGLGDWTIELSLAAGPPTWCAEADNGRSPGHSLAMPEFKRAEVWTSNERCRVEGLADALEALFHELLHVSCDDAGLDGHGRAHGEYVIDRLADVLVWAYRRGMKP